MEPVPEQTGCAAEPCVEDLFSEGPSGDEGAFWGAVDKDCDARAKQQEAQALMLVSQKLREDARRTREVRAQLGPSTPQKAKQSLISRFMADTPSPPAAQEGTLEGRRGRRGPKHPCYMNAEEREQAIKKKAIRQQDESLRIQALELESQAKAAEELSNEAAAVASQAIAILEPHDVVSDLAEASEVLQVIARRGRGRPPHTAEQKAAAKERKAKVKAQKGKLQPEDRERMQTPSATARSMIVDRVDALSKEVDNYTTNEFWSLAEDLCGVPASMLKRFAKPEEREKLSRYLDARGPERFISTDTGCRLSKDGAKKKTYESPVKDVYDYVKAWKDRQEEIGFELNQEDLVDEFELELESRVFDLKERLAKLAAPGNRKYARARLGSWCGVVEHKPSNVVPFTAAENDLICKLSYQAWDWLVDLLMTATADELQGFVADAQGLVENRRQLAVIAQGASPVYLDCSTGKVLVRTSFLDERQKRRRLRLAAQKDPSAPVPEIMSVAQPSDAVGSSRREKNRLTFFFRQALEGLWDPDVAVPTGKVLDGVLLAVASKHYRLEDMSFFEPAQRLRGHSFSLDGVMVKRVKGEAVGPLGSEWRAARRHNKATEDTIIASFLTDLSVEEGYQYSLKTVDCVASEHSEIMDLHNYMHNQVVHTIGMRQTAKTQVTDVREAVIGKAGGEKVKHQRRRLKRLAGNMSGQASDLTSDKVDLMHIAQGMQVECRRDNAENQGVLKAFRMGGWLAHKPTDRGLVPLVGPAWRQFPLGSSRLSNSLMADRVNYVPVHGKPEKPDWGQLRALRARQRAAYVQQKGQGISEDRKQELLLDDEEIDGFVSYLGGWGQRPFAEHEEALAAAASDPSLAKGPLRPFEPISLAGLISAEALAEEAAFQSLHPRVKQAILAGGAIAKMPKVTKSFRGLAAEKRVEKAMTRKTQAAEKKAEWRAAIDSLGIEAARKQLCVPAVVTKAAKKTKEQAKTKGKKGGAGSTKRRQAKKGKQKAAARKGARAKAAATFAGNVATLEAKLKTLQAQLHGAGQEAESQKQEAKQGAEALAAPPGEQPAAAAAAERKRLRVHADNLTVRSLQLQGLHRQLQDQQQELENANKLGQKALGQVKRKANAAMQAAERALAKKPRTGEVGEGAGIGGAVGLPPPPPLAPTAPSVPSGPAGDPGAAGSPRPLAAPVADLLAAASPAQAAPSAGDAGELGANDDWLGVASAADSARSPPPPPPPPAGSPAPDAPAASARAAGAAAALPTGCAGAAPLPAAAPRLEPGCRVQVDCDAVWASDRAAAARLTSGLWGTVASAKGPSAWIHPGGDTSANKRQVPVSWLVPVPDEPSKPLPWRKNAGWLGKEQREEIRKAWLPVDIEVRRAPGARTLLSEAELAIAAVEIGWRLTPPRCLVAPPRITALVAHHVRNHDAAHDRYGEGEELVAELRRYADRACVPAAVEADTKLDGYGVGCGACGGAGCKTCSCTHAERWLGRLSKESEFITPCTSLAPLEPATWWNIRYYDSLRQPSRACADCAHALLDALQPVGVQNVLSAKELAASRANKAFQSDGSSCGWWCLHHMETEFRRFVGETSVAFDLQRRVDLAYPIVSKFLP
ncbi:unnamed protein product [Prorocentrum cordatum]|uniref:Uncharacterized protein n=1 Tax=Prorocentrum cordatum TaxID=2364126 RepID=A0ABN9XJI8_9DINO|nr:unnamed protein product [Polarella glacialis]